MRRSSVLNALLRWAESQRTVVPEIWPDSQKDKWRLCSHNSNQSRHPPHMKHSPQRQCTVQEHETRTRGSRASLFLLLGLEAVRSLPHLLLLEVELVRHVDDRKVLHPPAHTRADTGQATSRASATGGTSKARHPPAARERSGIRCVAPGRGRPTRDTACRTCLQPSNQSISISTTNNQV